MEKSKPNYEDRSVRANVKGIMETYSSTGKIGKITPKDEKHARRIARAISRATRDRASK